MTRQRAVTPETFALPALVKLPPAVRLTEVGLRMHADDHGRGRVRLRHILADVFPETSEITEAVLVDHLLQLAEADVIVLYEDGDESCFEFVDWPRVDRAGKSNVPPAPPRARSSRRSRESFVAGESEREREGESGREREWASESESEREPASRMSREGLPPDPFCAEHPGGVEFPCIACQNARLRNQHYKDRMRWELAQELRGDS